MNGSQCHLVSHGHEFDSSPPRYLAQKYDSCPNLKGWYGELDVGDGCWRQNMLMTSLRC